MLYPRDAPRILLLAREKELKESKLRREFRGMGIVHQALGENTVDRKLTKAVKI
jgi:hypothetical protein